MFRLIVSVCLVLVGEAVILDGTIRTFENFHFLARFCFRPNNGKASFYFTYRRENVDGVVPTYNSLLMYSDGEEQWTAVYKTPLTCKDKVEVLSGQNDTDQIAELRANQAAYCTQEDNTAPLINCTSNYANKESLYDMGDPNIVTFHDGYIGFQNSRARWWYFAISNCHNPNGVTEMKYKVVLTNGNTFWNKHVSADQIGILETDIVFASLFLYLTLASVKISRVLAAKQLFHTSFKIFITSTVFQVLTTLVYVVYRVMINMGGSEYLQFKYLGRGLSVVSETLFILLVILLSKGWTVVRGRLSTTGTMFISISITFYFLAQVATLFWEAYMFDPGEVLYEYESAPGYVCMAFLIVMWIWFSSCNYNTLKSYPDKNKFYAIFYIAYTVWFLAKPIIVMMASFQLKDHYREKAVNVVLNANQFLAYSVFLFLTRPSTNNKLFPFTVKTTQIGVSVTTDDVVDSAGAPKAASFERTNMFKASGPGGRADAYSIGFSSVAYNAAAGEGGTEPHHALSHV